MGGNIGPKTATPSRIFVSLGSLQPQIHLLASNIISHRLHTCEKSYNAGSFSKQSVWVIRYSKTLADLCRANTSRLGVTLFSYVITSGTFENAKREPSSQWEASLCLSSHTTAVQTCPPRSLFAFANFRAVYLPISEWLLKLDSSQMAPCLFLRWCNSQARTDYLMLIVSLFSPIQGGHRKPKWRWRRHFSTTWSGLGTWSS